MKRSTESYFENVSESGFDHQRDAYEQGYEDAVARIREAIDERREHYWDGSRDGYVWFDDLYELLGDGE